MIQLSIILMTEVQMQLPDFFMQKSKISRDNSEE